MSLFILDLAPRAIEQGESRDHVARRRIARAVDRLALLSPVQDAEQRIAREGAEVVGGQAGFVGHQVTVGRDAISRYENRTSDFGWTGSHRFTEVA